MTIANRRIAFLSHHESPEALPALERAAFDWLSARPGYEVEFLPFDQAGRLRDFDAAWWYYSESPELPAAALAARDQIAAYVEGGGKLLLSLLAARFVKPLGIDRAPDAVVCKEEGWFYNNGYVAVSPHPIFDGLPKLFQVAHGGMLRPMVSARWVEAPPENGRVLAIATWGARFVESERVVVEWDDGAGQVLAVGMHNFRFDGDGPSENLAKFADNIFRYLTAPLVINVQLEAESGSSKSGRSGVAVPSGAGYLGGHYQDGGVVAEVGQPVRALVTGKAWRPLDVSITAQTPAGAAQQSMSLAPGQKLSVGLPLKTDDLGPGEHSAAVEVAAGGQTVAAVERTFFIVPSPSAAGPMDRHWLWEIRSKHLAAEIEKATGTIWGLYDPTDERPVQFAANPDNLPALATSEHRWLGDLALKFRFEGDTQWRSMTTAQSAEIRQVRAQADSVVVVYDPGAPEQTGPADPAVSERFTPDKDGLNWRIRIRNRSDTSLILGELAIPLALNAFFGGEVDLQEIYERKVMLHSFVGGSSSWVLAAPLGGRPPYLLLWCKQGTRLEAIAHVDDYGPRPSSWEGLISVFPCSKASQDTRGWKEWFNGNTAAPIPPGKELVLNFGVKFIRDYKEVGQTLLAAGKVAVDVAPGMVLPTDMTGHLRVRSRRRPTVGGDRQTRITLARTVGQASIYRFRFTRPGQHNLTITDDAGELTNLHFLAIEPIWKLARAHAAHVARDQQVRAAGWRDGMFLMWDAEESRMVMNPRSSFMSGGSDEIGFADALPLVWKNVVDPVPKEIAAMEYYVEHFLYGTLQKRDTYEVAAILTGYPNARVDYSRSFNYPHVVNIYFALSQIADLYGLTRFRDADGYLMMAYRTALTYFTVPMYKDNARTVGNFGESLYFDLAAALRAKGHAAEADELERHIRRKAEFFMTKPYPYLSEFPFDTTGYSDAYYLKKFAGGAEGAAPVVRMLRATRGRQFSWWWYGGDVRWGWGCSKYPYPDELCLNYMTSQNGRALLDHFHDTGDIEDLRIGYGSFLAYWALVRPDGVARNLYTWEPQRMTFDPWSSEMGCGLYFTYLMACSYVVNDPDLGLIGYGCDVEGDPKTHLSVVPHDGVAKRIRIGPLGMLIESPAARIERLDVEAGGRKIALVLRETLGRQLSAPLVIGGLQAGKYKLTADGHDLGTFTAKQCASGLRIPLPGGSRITVHLAR
jgi:hypothetical protein